MAGCGKSISFMSCIKMKKGLLLLVIFVSIISHYCYAQTYQFKNLSVEDGLALSTVLDIFQDSRGYMWFATNGGGVSRYDGQTFKNYGTNDSLASPYVLDIAEDEKGNIYFATNGGLSVFDGSTFKNYREADGLKSLALNEVEYDKFNKRILIGSRNGIYVFEKNRISKFSEVEDKDSLIHKAFVSVIKVVDTKTFWIGTKQNGAFLIKSGNFSNYTLSEGLTDNYVKYILPDNFGGVWISTLKGFDYLKSGKITHNNPVVPEIDEFESTVNKATFDGDGNVWFSTQAGLIYYSYKNDTSILYRNVNGLPTVLFWSILKDTENNLWFGSLDKGVFQLKNQAIYNYNRNDSISNDNIISVFCDRSNNTWVGGSNFGAYKLDKNNKLIERFSTKVSLGKLKGTIITSANVRSVLEDREKGIIYFAEESGLDIYDGKTAKNYVIEGDKFLLSLFKLKNKVLIGSQKGLQIFENDSLTKKTIASSQIKSPIWEILQLKNELYYATYDGLFKTDLNLTRIEKITAENFTDTKIRNLAVDNKNNLWIAAEKGLYRYNGKSFKLFTEEDGLSTNTIYSLLYDKGILWIGNSKGIDKLDVALFNKNLQIKIRRFNKSEGFVGDECNIGAIAKDWKGRIVFGTVKGVTVFDPALERENKVEPKTNINHLKLFFEEFDFKPYCDSINAHTGLPIHLVLPYNKNHLSFDFIGISLAAPEKVRYQFMLENSDEKWSPITDRTEAVYSNIAPGTYTFKVIACNNDGIWNSTPTTFTFTIEPPIWQRPWFIALSIIVLITGIYFFIKYRERALVQQKEKLENQVAERTHELREEKEKVEQINVEVLEQKAIIEEKNKDITDSINYAKRIQDAVLPATDAIKQGFEQSFILYRPKDIVSGDFYWYTRKGNKHFIAAADCTGHGVPGAFMSMIGTNLLNQIVMDYGVTEPGEILSSLNKNLKKAFSQSNHKFDTKDGMDIALCSYDPDKNELSFAGAQRSLYFIRNEELKEVKGTKTPIGAQTPEDFVFDNLKMTIAKGDCFYITSDGYADQFGGPDGRKFMTKKFKEIILKIHKQPMQAQHDALNKTIIDWMGTEHEQIDDELVIGFRF